MSSIDFADLLDRHLDFPRAGILFYDIAPLLKQPDALHQLIELLADRFSSVQYDSICGIDSRGFIFGSLLAFHLKKPFFMARKPGKLPGETVQSHYQMEYGNNTLEIQTSAIEAGKRVLIIDDLLATGNTAKSTATLIEQAGGIIAGFGFVIELHELSGRELLKDYLVETIVQL